MENLTLNEDKALILGGTGKTGKRIVKQLTDRGVAVRIGSRAQAPGFDWNNPYNWDEILSGITSVYINYAPDLAIPGSATAIQLLMDHIAKNNIKRVVLLSGRGEDEAQHCESLIQRPNIDWTVVRASWFAQNFSEGAFAEMISRGTVTLPAGEVKEPFIDIEDIVDVVVAALTETGHENKIYEVTGPRLLTFSQAIQEIASATGCNINYQQITVAEFIHGAVQTGIPADIVWLLEYLFATVLDGRNEYTTDGVQQALGREPRDFSEFAAGMASTDSWKIA